MTPSTISGEDSIAPGRKLQSSRPVRAFIAINRPVAPAWCFRQGSSCINTW